MQEHEAPPLAAPGQGLATLGLRAISVILVGLGLWTMWPGGERENGIGYRSSCPFAPTSTLMLVLPAAFAWHAAGKVGRDEDD